MPSTYYLDINGDRQTIRSTINKVAIEIYELDNELFAAQDGQVTLYGNNDGALLAFVSVGPRNRFNEISPALEWYAKHLAIDDLNISILDPRPTSFMRVVR